ncbi:MAG: rhomboid family intramembrane serine protease [Saprospiraceae bacterium]|nr:rhomboid family intramembrane serine protease [Saprospiraceae bacterium]MBK9221209.1 rhomboid family intramembrane serine protease [Saprospiraceae bacterium]MBK9721856.1 rhomboid family intramembrane serine protease [Saprospiraceae bacterium]MBK9728917.1 rhomboid family intramembrane serine protease [Saprospiraceae bacterium]
MTELSKEKERFFNSLNVALSVSILCILVHLVFLILPIHKYDWSIYPRDLGQWYGIFTGQFIHASWGHLFSNLPPLFITTLVLFYFYRTIGLASFSLLLMATGFMVFLFGRNYSHIGASGLVYGLISFIFFSGIFRRNVKSIVLMTIMVIMYSGYLAGFFPTDERVSWEAHLFGAIAGLWTAFIFRKYRESDEEPIKYDWKGQDRTPKEYFLQRNSFEKTISEREQENSDLQDSQDFQNTTRE